jgi:23S rRNA pseudouridine2605 synthase
MRALTMEFEGEPTGPERLQKVLSRAGIASRRRVEQLMQEGRITVNDQIADEMGMRVDPLRDTVTVDGKVVSLDFSMRYILLHKPKGVVSTLADENGRPDLSTYVDDIGERVFNVGRLDQDTTGLLLLTNDGELAHRLAHPSFEVDKVYVATVKGSVTPATLSALTTGVALEDGVTKADRAKRVGEPRDSTSVVELVMHSGKNRIVRRLLEAVGHPVIDLHRRSFGSLHLGGLKPGHWRDLTRLEVSTLLTLAHRSVESTEEFSDDRTD